MRGHVRTRAGEPRPGVAVSDGLTVTVTAHDGSWSLTPTGPFVHVVRPADSACEPWFVPASADPGATHDFVLDPVPDVFPHRFVHVSDTHVGAGPRLGSLIRLRWRSGRGRSSAASSRGCRRSSPTSPRWW